MRPRARRFAVAAGAAMVAVLLAMALIEAWVRIEWDDTRGTPGFFLTDAARGQRLAPGYDGWFAGVPVRINALGFRDRRDYTLDKPAGTFRILVLGDSVTFGHGTLDDTTYPYLLEQRLRGWRPDIKWEVWNLGVPGYNTRQELNYLEEIGPRAQPDLVIVGFLPNDFTGNNGETPQPSAIRRGAAALFRVIQRHVYSYEFYKRAILTLRWRLLTSEADRLRIEHLTTEQELVARSGSVADDEAQRLTEVEYVNDPDAEKYSCDGSTAPPTITSNTVAARLRQRAPDLQGWFSAVEDFQQLHRDGRYRILFFVNMAPVACPGVDRFFDGGRLADDEALLEVLGRDTPAVSSTRAFFHHRPSQMPAAGDHAIGNSNVVKAQVLFEYLRERILPPLIPGPLAQ
jgi:lysophospholipase L1-like esterase